jgi:hypothetical protein
MTQKRGVRRTVARTIAQQWRMYVQATPFRDRLDSVVVCETVSERVCMCLCIFLCVCVYMLPLKCVISLFHRIYRFLHTVTERFS